MNRTKALLQSGRPAIGTFVFLRDPAVIDAAGIAALDFVVIDCEHSGKSIETIENMVRAAEAANVTPIARVPSIEEKVILQILETGVQGIMFPYVSDSAMATRASKAVRFPPDGVRGTCRISRSARYGSEMNRLSQYMAHTNEDLLTICTIEDESGVENIKDILKAGHFDVCVVGRGDLSSNLGVPGQVDHPAVQRATLQIETALRQTSCVLGIASYDLQESRRLIERHARFVIFSADTCMLWSAMQQAAAEIRR